MKPEDIKSRFNALTSQRKTLEQVWQQVEQFVVPFRGKFFRPQSSEHEISWRQVQLFDTTAVQACDTLAAAMQGSLTSPSAMWFGLQFQDDDLNTKLEATRWLEACSQEIFDSLQSSNFNIEASELYLDLCSFGSGIFTEEVVSEDEWQGIDFQAVPVREAFFEPDFKQQVETFYRRLQWTPVQMISKFGKKNVPQDIVDQAGATASTDMKHEIVFCIFPRKNLGPIDLSQPIPPKGRPFGYKYVLLRDATQLGEEGGYYENPAFIPRWRKVSGSMWGHSPAMICLPDIMNINELVEATLEAAGKVIDPAVLTTQRGLIGDLDLGRGGLTTVRNPTDVVPFDPGSRFDVAQSVYEMFQMSIRRTFRVDQLELKESPAMTATEVQVRYELMQRLLGPTLGRLQSDFLNPMIQRTFNILMRAGRLPEAPSIVEEAKSKMRIEYTGPLPRAQKMDTVRNAQEWLIVIAQATEMFPELQDLVDPDGFGRGTAKLMSVPATMLRSQEEVLELRKERAEEEAQANETITAQAEGEAAQAQGKGMQELNNAFIPGAAA